MPHTDYILIHAVLYFYLKSSVCNLIQLLSPLNSYKHLQIIYIVHVISNTWECQMMVLVSSVSMCMALLVYTGGIADS